jgi:hypothetical protein
VNERELDRVLMQGRKEAGAFFSGFKPAPKELAAGAVGRSRRTWRPQATIRVTAAVVCVAAAIACALLLLSPSESRTLRSAAAQSDNTSAQTVALGEDKEYRMNYIPTAAQDGAAPGIMTVLWELSGDGNQQMAYSSVFEYCDTVYPAMIIPFSGADYDMLLIASGDSAHGSIGYRLVGYRADAIQTWWSRDDLQGGVISVQDGVAVEKAADGTQQAGARVTYIVPVQIASGALALPVSRLRLGVGEQLLLIGGGTDDVVVQSQNGLMSPLDSERYGGSAAMFTAVNAGEDVLRVGGEQSENRLTVSIVNN